MFKMKVKLTVLIILIATFNSALIADSINLAISPQFSVAKYKKVAIICRPYKDLNVAARKFRDTLEIELLKIGFIIIERSHINRIMEEQKFNMTGMVDHSSVIKLGQIAGAQAIVLFRHKRNHIRYSKFAYIKIIDVNNGVILIAASWEKSRKQKNISPSVPAKKVARSIMKKLKKRK
ncbi:hypothetical protein ACFL20_03300 [Spirochaetota bacterium]